MSFTVVMHSESIDTGASLDTIAAVTDQHITTEGDDVVVPERYSKLIGVYAVGVDISRVRMNSPSLRRTLLLDCPNFDINAVPESENPPSFNDLTRSPIQLDPSEGLRAEVINDGASASRVDVLSFLGGELRPIPEGRIETVRLTGTTTLTANAWTLVNLTLSQQLPKGRYAVVGARFESAGAVAGRLVLQNADNRPGCVARDSAEDVDIPMFRRGGLGWIWGEFDHRYSPQAEFFSSSADTAETVYLDIIKIGE